jgi:large subunit ribosomal protein L37Ae
MGGYLKLFTRKIIITGEFMKKTKKVKSAGRFGSRYGVGIRKKITKVEERQNKAATCPFCKFKKLRRKAAGLFECKKCGAEFTGGAYESETLIGKTIKKMVVQKSFAANAAELVKESETSSYSDIEAEVSKSIDEEEIAQVEVATEKATKKKAVKKTKKKKEVEEVEDKE